MVQIFTIGFTKSSAQNFFDRLRLSSAKKLIDVRLNNVSQLSGFAKKDDLRFFLRNLCNMDYIHVPKFAPTSSILDQYRKGSLPWDDYEQAFNDLIKGRKIETVSKKDMDGCCLLCSEDTPHFCHRRLVAEYFAEAWGDVDIVHL